jgi:hypothetical protein
MAVQVKTDPATKSAVQPSNEALAPEEIEVGLIPLPSALKNLAFRLFGYPQLAE